MKKLLALISACAVLFTASITTGCGKNGGESNMGYNRANIIRSLMFSETTTDLGEKNPVRRAFGSFCRRYRRNEV